MCWGGGEIEEEEKGEKEDQEYLRFLVTIFKLAPQDFIPAGKQCPSLLFHTSDFVVYSYFFCKSGSFSQLRKFYMHTLTLHFLWHWKLKLSGTMCWKSSRLKRNQYSKKDGYLWATMDASSLPEFKSLVYIICNSHIKINPK